MILSPHSPALILAPMEGVTDAPMRAVQGESGAFTFGVSEFLRVAQLVPPKHVFLKHVPELRSGGRTTSGMPVQVQLLGGHSGRMAGAAVVACELGAGAIDINFGCPAKTVNRHDGGATLLKFPLRIREIVAAVRASVPAAIPVSAKLRLGWDTLDAIDENAEMAAEGGASWITIHGRTRQAGYAPPIHWGPIGRVRARLKIPVVANGDIWTRDDFQRCRDATGCRHFMLGRGALANPELAMQVAVEMGLRTRDEIEVKDWSTLLNRLVNRSREHYDAEGGRLLRRLKQWLSLATRYGTFAYFDSIKRASTVEGLMREVESVHPSHSGCVAVPSN